MTPAERFLAPLRLNAGPAERNRLVLGFVVIVVIAAALRIHTATWYDPFFQHDPDRHLPILRAAIHLTTFTNNNAPYYYYLVAMLGAPFAALYRLRLITEPTFFVLATAWSGLVFQTLYIYGCLLFARQLRFRLRTQLAFVALCIFLPPIQRSFSMLRPENLILMLAPFLCVLFIVSWRNVRRGTPVADIPAVGMAAIIATVVSAQKVNGMFIVAGLGAAFLAFTPGSLRERVSRPWRPTTLFVCLTVALLIAQKLLIGESFLYNPGYDEPKYQGKPKAEVFVALDPVDAWRAPLRPSQAGSMPNILLIDLYGDYRRYGSSHFTLHGFSKAWLVARARFGLVISFLFVGIYVVGFIRLVLANRRQAEGAGFLARERLGLSILFYLGFVVLILTAFALYNKATFNIIKWEYITFFVPFAMIPLADLLERSRGRAWGPAVNTAALVLMVAGIAQSIAPVL